MDENQKDHLKAYGAAFWIVGEQINVEWVLNFRGGSFIVDYYQKIMHTFKNPTSNIRKR